jgi:hypothetical protein
VDDFTMVEMMYESRYSDINLLFAHQVQRVYYLSYHHKSMKQWWVVYKVNPKIHTHRCDAYVERHDDDDVVHIYQEQNEGHQSLSFIVSNEAGQVLQRNAFRKGRPNT